MENEKLSNAYVQKYDPISDSFVVVESQSEQKQRKMEPFSFFRRKTKVMESDNTMPTSDNPTILPDSQPMPQPAPSIPNNTVQPNPPAPPYSPNPPQRPMPTPNTSVILARNLYNRMRILHSLYLSMARTYPTKNDFYTSLTNEISILQATILSIYQSLSGNNFVPEQRESVPILTRNYCQDIAIVQNYLQDVIELTISLQRAVNVQNIDRQLTIISATLLSQQNKLSTEQNTYCQNRQQSEDDKIENSDEDEIL